MNVLDVIEETIKCPESVEQRKLLETAKEYKVSFNPPNTV
jgi:hypothetical protein